MNQRHAVIDIGTNSVKLLVADVDRTVSPVLKMSRQTRLGQGAFQTKRLQPEAIARTVDAVTDLAAAAARLQPATIQVLATSAAREAVNCGELVHAIERAVGLSVEIISGDQEADYVFGSVANEPAFAQRPMMIIDVGGGSTEWIVGEGGFSYWRGSARLGTSRLLEMQPPSDPPTAADLAVCRRTVADLILQEVRPKFQSGLRTFYGREVGLVGIGGAIKTLARLSAESASPQEGGPLRLSREHLHEQVERLWSLSLSERRGLEGLDPAKADIILAGGIIYEAVMDSFHFSELFVGRGGLREGAIIARATAREPESSAPKPGHSFSLSTPGAALLLNRAPIPAGIRDHARCPEPPPAPPNSL